MAKLILHKSAPVGLGSPKYLENSATELVTSRKTRELVTVRLREVTNSVAELGKMSFTISFVYEKCNF